MTKEEDSSYRIWREYFPGSGYAFAEDLEGLTHEQISRIVAGERVKGSLPTIKVTQLTRGKLPDALATAWAVRIVAENIKKVLESYCPEKIQFLPAVVRRSPKLKYHLANVLANSNCFDRERSAFTTLPSDPDIIIKIRKLVLKPIPADTPALVHVADLPWIWLIRDDLREEMQLVSSSPGTFTKIVDYTSG